MIKITNLEKVFDKSVKALSGVNLEVKQGEIFGLLGPNGAGKSTIIKVLTTIEKPTAGKCLVNGFNVVNEALDVRMQFGVVSQDLTLDSKLTAWDNLYLTARYYHIKSSEIKIAIERTLKIVNLWDDRNRLVEEFSGGMKKRLDIAAALMHNPKIIFLDEPTVGLDLQSRKEIWKYINYLVSEYKVTVFLTTHYMEEADNLCDRIAIFDRGLVKALDTPTNLKQKLKGDLIIVKPKNNDDDKIFHILDSEDYISSVKKNKNQYVMLVDNSEKCIPKVFQCLKENNVEIELLFTKKPTLDDVFLDVTGNELGSEDSRRTSDVHRRGGKH